MNRSFSKIRHIQESNQRLERRFLFEDKEINIGNLNQMVSEIQSMLSESDKESFSECLEKGNYPNLKRLAGAGIMVAITVVLIVINVVAAAPTAGESVTVSSWAFATVVSSLEALYGGASVYDEIKKMDMKALIAECKTIGKCFKPSWWDTFSIF